MSAAPLLVWDREAEPSDDSAALRWRTFSGGSSSIPAYVEAHAERLRAKYLAFVYDLGESRIAGKTVVEHLAFDGSFSFWWMTRLAEKSPYKSPGIYAALRLFALEEMLLEKNPSRLELATEDEDLSEAIAALCRNRGIDFARRAGGRQRQSFRDRFPYAVKGLRAFARHLAAWRPLRRFDRPRWFSGDAAVFVCSFFAHLDTESCARGEFRSHYWEVLPGRLHDAGRRINWIHHYLHGYSSDAPDARTSLSWLERYNADAERQGRHSFLESYMSFGAAVRAALNWLRLNAVARRLSAIPEAFSPKDSGVWLWPVLRDDWMTSLSGSVGALNCLWVELFDAALADIPPQKTGLYLCENQAWEPALIRAWRKHGHGEIFGVAHTTVPFWHLYYFDDPRVFERGRGPAKPLPDRLAVSGPAATRIFAGVGHPANSLVEVEALRYLDLPRLAAARPTGAGARVIILGDVIPDSMRSLLSNLEGALKLLPAGYRFALKLHPLYAVDLAEYPGLSVERTTEPLERILGDFDIALSANGTSAAVDAYQAGMPVIIGLNGADLNLSPLRGEPGVSFAGTPEELAQALRAAGRTPAAAPSRDEFFLLDPKLPRWRRLLKMDATN